tara:strand:+ start:191 stop:868 length:678 start_codon:yes stop_codon:yes gene_type:complete
MDAVVVPGLELGGAATVAAGVAAIAAGQAAIAAVQEATPRSTVQHLQDNGIMPQRVRRLSQTARRVSLSVVRAQQEWLMRNIELYNPSVLSPRTPGAGAAAAPAVMTSATTLGAVPQALVEGRVFFSAKLSALMAAGTGALVWCGVSTISQQQAADSKAEVEASEPQYLLGIAVVAALLLIGTAGFFAGRTSAPVLVEVGWQREESREPGDSSKKKRGRLQRVHA